MDSYIAGTRMLQCGHEQCVSLDGFDVPPRGALRPRELDEGDNCPSVADWAPARLGAGAPAHGADPLSRRRAWVAALWERRPYSWAPHCAGAMRIPLLGEAER